MMSNQPKALELVDELEYARPIWYSLLGDRIEVVSRAISMLREQHAEIERLKQGDFTAEEFQALCHKEPPLSFCDFVNGCHKYQRELFGKSDRDEMSAEIERLKTEKVEPSDAHPYGDGKRPFGWDPMAHE